MITESVIELKNTTRYDFPFVLGNIDYLDETGDVVSSSQMGSGDNVKPNSTFCCENTLYCNEKFSGFRLRFSYWDRYGNDRYVTIYPRIQYAWDGKELYCNDAPTDAQESFAVENASFDWITHRGRVVPSVKFTLLNTGSTEASDVVLTCVYINEETNTIWDEDKVYVCTSSTASLQAGQGKLVSSASDAGYTNEPSTLPNMRVEFYVNGKPVGQFSSNP